MKGRWGLIAVALAAMVVPAGGDSAGTQRTGRSRTLDDRFAEIEARAPGFGGLFRDADGRLVVRMADMREAAAAEEAVAGLVGGEEVARSGGVRLIRGDYTFSQLSEWKRQAAAVHGIPGVSLTDVDEAANRVRIGLADESAREAVERELDRLGIPREAVNIDVTGPFEFLASVQSKFRPVVGGIQIAFGCDAFSCFVCTDGFTAVRDGVKGLVTNSHCTINQGGVDGTIYMQPIPTSSPNRIGTEIADPTFVAGGGCPASTLCRDSDSAFVSRKKKVKWSLGGIARPNAPGLLTMSSKSQRFRITSEGPLPMVGDVLNKVGRTTGWSQGSVTGTCADILVAGTNLGLFCQDIVGATADGGDSGSPVFRITSGNDVALYGILWGGAGGEFAFSRLASIEDELGPLQTCDPAFGC